MMMKTARVFGVLGLAAALTLVGCSSAPEAEAESSGEATPEGPLVIASWGGAFSEATRELAAQFTADTGIEVEVLDTGSHVATVQQMSDSGTTEWDLLDGMAIQDGYFMDQAGLLEHWDADTKAHLVEQYGADNVTDYDFAWSGYGMVIVCNADAVAKCPTTIEEFYDVENFPGNRMLPGDPGFFNSLVHSLAVATGSDRDDLFEEDEGVERIAEGLRQVAPSTTVWYASGDAQNQAILQGEADMGIMASGRAYAVQDEGVNLQISWDGVYLIGSSVVLKDAPHKEAAIAYVNWLADNPEAQAGWSEALGYTVPHKDALEYIDPATAERLATYPANFAGLVRQDFVWHSKNKQEVDQTFLDIIAGG